MRSPPPEEDRVAETTRDELTATPIPHALAPEIEKNGSKMKPGKNRGVGEGGFSFVFISCYPLLYSELVIN